MIIRLITKAADGTVRDEREVSVGQVDGCDVIDLAPPLHLQAGDQVLLSYEVEPDESPVHRPIGYIPNETTMAQLRALAPSTLAWPDGSPLGGMPEIFLDAEGP